MGGSHDSDVLIKKNIEQELGISILNSQKTISNIMNETLSKVATDIVQSNVAKIQQKISSSNIFTSGGDLDFGGKSVSNFDQRNNILAESSAIAHLVSDAGALQELAAKSASEMLNQQQATQNLQQQANQLATIVEKSKDAQGLEGVADSLVGVFTNFAKDITGGSDKKSATEITDIKSKMKQEFFSKSVIKSDLKNILDSVVKQSFKQSSDASCQQLIHAENVIAFDQGLKVMDNGKVNMKQAATIQDLRKCILNMNLGSEVSNKLGVTSENLQINLQKLLTDSKQKLDQMAEAEKTSTTTSGFERGFSAYVNTVAETWNSLFSSVSSLWMTSPVFMWLVIGCGVLLLIGLIGLALSGSGVKKVLGKDYSSSEDDEQVGGFVSLLDSLEIDSTVKGFDSLFDSLNSETSLSGGANFNMPDIITNNYLWIFIAILIFFIFGRTFPMISVIIMVIIGYVIYNSKKNLH